MATHLLLYSVDDLVMGSVDCEGSIWTLAIGELSNKYAIRLKLVHTGIVARFSLGPWHSPNLNIAGTKQAAGDTVIFRPGTICVDVETPASKWILREAAKISLSRDLLCRTLP